MGRGSYFLMIPRWGGLGRFYALSLTCPIDECVCLTGNPSMVDLCVLHTLENYG